MNIKKEAERRIGLFLDIEPETYPYYYSTKYAIIMTEHLIMATLYDKIKNSYEGAVLEELKSRMEQMKLSKKKDK